MAMTNQADGQPVPELPDHGSMRYTEEARQLVTRAYEEARHLRHAYVGGEHLLLALLHHGRGNAARVLAALSLDFIEVESSLGFMIEPGDAPPTHNLELTARLSQAFQLAHDEAQRRNLQALGTEDLLLGLVAERNNVAARLLARYDITEPVVRKWITRLDADQERDVSPRIKGNVLTCRLDDRDLAVIDALVEAGIRPTRSAAAAWLIHAGIEANQPLVDKVNAALSEIRRLREEMQGATSD